MRQNAPEGIPEGSTLNAQRTTLNAQLSTLQKQKP
jgi:hypothetical protein